MRAQAKQWGNSLAIRIPKAAADTLQLQADSEVELTVSDGMLLIKPQPQESLDSLLARVTPANLHAEVTSGPPRGQETW